MKSIKAIDILKKRMTLEERRKFVANAQRQEGEDWWRMLNKSSIGEGITTHGFLSEKIMSWDHSLEGWDYWHEIAQRFSIEELNTIIDFDNL